jgi:hypothetical protein
MAGSDSDGPPRAVLIAALLVAVSAIGVVLAIAAGRQPSAAPVPIPAVPAPQAADPACHTLLGALPDRLGAFRRAAAADPAPEGAAAWRSDPATEPVILRCGLDRPGEFVVGVPLQLVDDVQWFRIGGDAGLGTTWFAVDRPVYVALTLPADSGPTAIQEVSAVIARTLPARPIDPGPAR